MIAKRVALSRRAPLHYVRHRETTWGAGGLEKRAESRGGSSMHSVSEVVASHENGILESWSVEAHRIASARGLDRPHLLNIIPRYLKALGHSGGSPTDRERRMRLIERHVASRIREGFLLDEVVEEINILGRSITTAWSATGEPERPPSADVESLLLELHEATALVVQAFTEHMAEDEQAEKRFLRRLQKVVSEVSPTLPRGKPLGEHFDDVIALVMDAMEAQTVALVLYDPKSGSLITCAAGGLGADVLAGEVSKLDSGSFPARVASLSLEPTESEASDLANVEVSEALRAVGIRRLLGVRLPSQEHLQGVLYIGVTGNRVFVARDRRRIETLGEALSLHLENARLYADLRETISELESERGLRDRFISVLAHDLRGPLTSARLAAEQVASGGNGSTDESARRIVRSVDRADRMVRDLLDAMLIRAGRALPLEIQEADLVSVAREVTDEFSRIHPGRVNFESDGAVHGWWSVDDVHRAIWNLQANAFKYGRADGTVGTRVIRSADVVRISVHNDGAPIPPSDQARLFEAFSQGDAKGSRRHGWGLGLTLVAGCAAAHGGQVEVDSSESRGTTFTMVLPLDARSFAVSPRASSDAS
jgi:signal transduction histidine kinase